MSILPPTKRSQHYKGKFNGSVIAYCDDRIFVFLACVYLLDEVLGVLDGDLMWATIESVHHRYHVLLATLHPPRLKTQGGYVLYNR